MADPTRWEMADTVLGGVMAAASAIAGLFGWFGRKIGKVHDRIDALQERANEHASSIAVLEAHHEAKMQRLARIEDGLQALNEKNDRQMEILMDLRGRA